MISSANDTLQDAMKGARKCAKALAAGSVAAVPGLPARRVLIPPEISVRELPHGLPLHDLQGHAMGTTWSVRLAGHCSGPELQRLRGQLQQQLDMLVQQMSHWLTDSDLGRFNRAPAGTWHPLPQPFFNVLAIGLQLVQASGGAYDPSAGALVNLWGFGPNAAWQAGTEAAPPGDADIEVWLRQRASHAVRLDMVNQLAWQPGSVQLDLSSIAKGYAVDELSGLLQAGGWPHHLVEVGGELRGEGLRPDGQPWWVALEQPAPLAATPCDRHTTPAPEPSPLVLALHGLSVATSGDYRRWLQHRGRRYSHTLDPRSGRPVTHGLASVTVVHRQAMWADAWSTALTVLGPQDGLALAEELGLAARFVTRNAGGCVERISRALRDMLA